MCATRGTVVCASAASELVEGRLQSVCARNTPCISCKCRVRENFAKLAAQQGRKCCLRGGYILVFAYLQARVWASAPIASARMATVAKEAAIPSVACCNFFTVGVLIYTTISSYSCSTAVSVVGKYSCIYSCTVDVDQVPQIPYLNNP